MKKLPSILFTLLFLFLYVASSAADLTVTFIDVGQGDAILIEAPNGRTMLIDAGGTPYWKESNYDPGEAVVVPLIKSKNIKKLDYVIQTHSDGDHIGGMAAVVLKIPVGVVFENGFKADTPEFTELHNIINYNHLVSSILVQGMRIDLDPSVKIDVLSPPKNDYFEENNSNSIVIRMQYGEVSFLFPGDIKYDRESAILRDYGDKVQSTILKVSHHGSATSTSEEFLSYVSPEIAVIQVGSANGFGHPSVDVLQKLRAEGIDIFRTDRMGNIEIKTNGDRFWIKTQRPVKKTKNKVE